MTGSTAGRGYGGKHQAERKRWAAAVDAGKVTCWRCGQPIIPGTPWDLGHDDHDRRLYRGPEHSACNRAAGARKANAKRGTTAPPPLCPVCKRPITPTTRHTSWRW